MSGWSAAGLFAVMLVLAAVPGVGVMVASARAAAHGFAQGAWTVLGIVAGDAVLIALAAAGLSLFAGILGGAAGFLPYLAAAYLLFLAGGLWRGAPPAARGGPSPASGFLAGLLVTLGDQKAVFFYLGLLPAFADVGRMTWRDGLALLAVAAAAILLAKLPYCWIAHRLGRPAAVPGRGFGRAAAVVTAAAAVGMLWRAGLGGGG